MLVLQVFRLKKYSFPKSKRLLTNSQFRSVLACKKCVSDDMLLVYAAKNDCGRARLGISIHRNIGKAVVRNRLKRMIREVFRLNQDQIAGNFDYLVMVTPDWASKLNEMASYSEVVKAASFEVIKDSLLKLMRLVAEKAKK